MMAMPDREKVIKAFEHLLNAAKGNYQDFVDLTVDGGEDVLALLKEQEEDLQAKSEAVSSLIAQIKERKLKDG